MEKGRDVERVKKVAYVSVQEADLLDKGIGRKESPKNSRRNNESLRMKFMDILDTAPSHKMHVADTPCLKENKENINNKQLGGKHKARLNTSNMQQSNHEQARDCIKIDGSRQTQNGKIVRKLNSPNAEETRENKSRNKSSKYQNGKFSRHKQDFDTIETDSGSHKQVVRRPITRSSTQKKAPPKTGNNLQENTNYDKNPLAFCSDFELKFDKKNMFPFDEIDGKSGSFNWITNSASNRMKEKNDDQKEPKIEPQGIVFPEFVTDKGLQNNDRAHKLSLPAKTSSYSKGKKGCRSLLSEGKKHVLQALNNLQNGSHDSQEKVQNHSGRPQVTFNENIFKNTESPLFEEAKSYVENDNSPQVRENNFLYKKDACSSMLREAGNVNDGQRQTLAFNMHSPSPALPPNEVLCGAQPSKFARESKMYGSKGFDDSSPGSFQSDTNTNATTDIHKSQNMESLHREEVTEKQSSPSPMKRQNTKSNIGDHKGKGRAKIHKWFSNDTKPENRSLKNKSPKSKTSKNKILKNSPFKHHHTRRDSGLNKTKINKKSNPSSLCPIGTAKTVGSLDILEQYPEDCLASSVTQLALVLRKFKAKLKAETFKESSKVLSEAADKIRLQLQGVEAQISSDVEKFVTVGKSKRKRIESELQEQQEKLRLIHDKFKEEVNLHLVDCQRSLEKLEACHVELTGTAEQKKVSHGELLVQVKQAVEVHISDAETKIAAIEKEANRKMNGLKRSLGEWN